MRPALLVAAVALALGSAACGSDAAMSKGDARTYTREALADLGFRQVEVADTVEGGVHGPDRAPVWRTRSEVDGGTVELAIEQEGTYVRFVRDVADDGGPLLTDAQFERLEDFSLDPAGRRRSADERGPGLVAAALLVTVVGGLAAAVFTGRLDGVGDERPASGPGGDRTGGDRTGGDRTGGGGPSPGASPDTAPDARSEATAPATG